MNDTGIGTDSGAVLCNYKHVAQYQYKLLQCGVLKLFSNLVVISNLHEEAR